MTHPFWMINSSLLGLISGAIFFVYFSKTPLPAREDISPVLSVGPKKEQHISVNIRKIYEQDLFNSYKKEAAPQERIPNLPFPAPPAPQKMMPTPVQKPTFLDPLPVTLKGIIVVHGFDEKNCAIIADNKTEREKTYKIGEKIEDAQLIRIFHNKIILLRTNGQQEVLYLREQDAQEDPVYLATRGWEHIIRPEGNNVYTISPLAFVERVQNVAQCIQLLGLTTAYQQGMVVGIRVAIENSNSLPSYLGFANGDLILSINGIVPNTTQNRMEIYNGIVKSGLSGPIVVKVIRNRREIELTYNLYEFEPPLPLLPAEKKPAEEKKEENTDSDEGDAESYYSFNATKQKMRAREREHMLAKRQNSRSLKDGDNL
ncbi:MAG TPA: type II secretion system protein N [Candidatus Bathyarchaeia archaeon]|nr:type II secretion system protein N [Candidatus Bathyarchaeia archaeon]